MIRRHGGDSPFVSTRVNIVQELSEFRRGGNPGQSVPEFRRSMVRREGTDRCHCLRGTRERIIQRSLERAPREKAVLIGSGF